MLQRNRQAQDGNEDRAFKSFAAMPSPEGQIRSWESHRSALGASLGIHGLAFALAFFGIPRSKSQPIVPPPQVLDAVLIEEAEPLPPQPVPEPPKPPAPAKEDALPEPQKPKPTPKPKEDERKRKIEMLRKRREDRNVEQIKLSTPSPAPVPTPQTAFQPPQPETPPQTHTAVTAQGKPFPYAYYLTLVQNKLWEVWRPPMAASDEILSVVSFQINRDGSVPKNSVKLAQGSGLQIFDQTCIAAVQEVQLPPLPQGCEDSSILINCRFRK